jgi:hypothetical protein
MYIEVGFVCSNRLMRILIRKCKESFEDYIHTCICLFPLVPSYNQPKFCPSASWNPNATTFANISILGSNPASIFVNTNNTVYVASQANTQIQVWLEESINVTRTIFGSWPWQYGLFVTAVGDIYVSYENYQYYYYYTPYFYYYYYYQMDKWTLNGSASVVPISINQLCYGIFVDISNTLYCSIYSLHQVVKIWLNDSVTIPTTIAGTGASGSTANALSYPYGIFVDINFDLYVADANNNRIQLFSLGQSNAKTVAGNGALGTVTLSWPTGVVLDADNYLFIVDQNNHRIVGSGPNGFQCLVGCYGGGSASYQLYYPQSMAFDSYGNIFVADRSNNRIQKFVLDTKFCGKHK